MKSLDKAIWTVDNSDLLMRYGEGSIIYPTASEVFNAEFNNKLLIQGHPVVSRPSVGIKDLVVSRFPLDLSIKIDNDPVGRLSCTVFGQRGEIEVEILNALSRKVDHIIFKNEWFPFAKGAIEEIRKILSSCNVNQQGPISLKQYLFFIRHEGNLIRIDDRTKRAAGADQFKSHHFTGHIPGFNGTLYPYQVNGYSWLRAIAKEDLGCILADEMGLGKTIQIIGLISNEIEEKRIPSLVICPATLLENWRREIKRFSPATKTMVHQGINRTAFVSDFEGIDVIIASYDTIVRDMPLFENVKWNIVIIDEAQAIKNPDAKRTRCVKDVPRRVAIAVTGTPVENRLTDLWSIMDFVLPQFLGTRTEFERNISDTQKGAIEIEPIVSPVLLRRKVSDVAKDLPERIDIPQPLPMDGLSIGQYEKIRLETISEYGNAGALVALNNLRMYCTHPYLFAKEEESPDVKSLKYRRVLEILEEIFANSEKALIFTSFTGMTDIFLEDLPQRFVGVHVDWIDGRVGIPDRQSKIDTFSRYRGPAVIILNPRAAGTGLNITAANHVIHYNPEWNPAIEDQASARAYRRGQERPVTVHKMFYANTVEEIIFERLKRKRDLAGAAVVGTTGSEEDLKDILKALQTTPHGEN